VRSVRIFPSLLIGGLTLVAALPGQQPDPTEFFEKKVRPVLVNNCQTCHNPKTKASGLDLSSAAGVAAGGTRGTVIAREHLENSLLLQAISYEANLKMPPTGKLAAEDAAALSTWVKMGAPWPGTPEATAPAPKQSVSVITPEQRQFWAFQPVKASAPPKVRNQAWVQSPIDAFILARLEEKGLAPAPPADKLRLLRRATFDLTGLPPSEAEIADFVADRSPDAWRKVVDRLLASPRYGERWARHWLDVVRYADSTGNDEDHRYPYAYRYRDYTIQAFNNDLPYDQFVREQIAGDLLPPPPGQRFNTQGVIATGFLALGAKALAQKDHQKMMYDIYDEQVDATSRAFLGLTMACARCHNHKFDPILAKDYYSLINVFANTRDFDGEKGSSKLLYVPLVPDAEYQQFRAQRSRIGDLTLSMQRLTDDEFERFCRESGAHVAEYMLAARKAGPETNLDPAVLALWVKYLDANAAKPQLTEWAQAKPEELPKIATAYQKRFEDGLTAYHDALEKFEKTARERIKAGEARGPGRVPIDRKNLFFADVIAFTGPFGMTDSRRQQMLSPERREQYAAFRKELDDLNAHLLPEPDMACAVREGEPVEQKIFLRGDYNNPGDDAPKAFPTVLAREDDPHFENRGSGRLQLAEWLSGPRNPMTARVMVNRMWQWHFGEGIVRTPDNFGRMGDRPTHPELLDYLADQFVRNGWSIKAMQRTIMLSSAYQMSSQGDPKSVETDPENLLLGRFNRQRLDIEEIRDGLLSLDGSLDLTMGGTLQSGFGTDGENAAGRLSLDPTKLTRRTVYLPLRRANLPTLLNLFDFGDATTPNGKRLLTNVAPQALFMMNSDFVFERADKLAKELLAASATSDSDRLRRAYLRILNRAPEASETDAALSYVRGYSQKYGHSEAAGWQSLCHILMSSNDFVYLD
jgi:Protein of unknown function (DUF1549)/Protein of unknown function (DUF1553)/Planctomycete cytochrome C